MSSSWLGVILAFFHMIISELRVWIILAFGSYKQFQAIASYRALDLSMKSDDVISCLARGNTTFKEVETCAFKMYDQFLVTGPTLFPYCYNTCPGARVDYLDKQVLILVWLCQFLAISGYVIMIILFFIKRPNYFKGDYLAFTQTIYTSKPYRWVLKPIALVIILLSVIWTIVLAVKWSVPGISVIMPILIVLLAFYMKTFYYRNFKHPEILSRVERVCRGNNPVQKVVHFLKPNQDVLQQLNLQICQLIFPDNINKVAIPPFDEEGLTAFLGNKAAHLLKSPPQESVTSKDGLTSEEPIVTYNSMENGTVLSGFSNNHTATPSDVNIDMDKDV